MIKKLYRQITSYVIEIGPFCFVPKFVKTPSSKHTYFEVFYSEIWQKLNGKLSYKKDAVKLEVTLNNDFNVVEFVFKSNNFSNKFTVHNVDFKSFEHIDFFLPRKLGLQLKSLIEKSFVLPCKLQSQLHTKNTMLSLNIPINEDEYFMREYVADVAKAFYISSLEGGVYSLKTNIPIIFWNELIENLPKGLFKIEYCDR